MPEPVDSDHVRELAAAVSEQSRIIEDFVRDSEQRSAEFTRRLVALEEHAKTPSALLNQATSRDTATANAVNELRAKNTEFSSGLNSLRSELNKWEGEINDRFLNLEKTLGRSVPANIDARLLDLERKIKALDTSLDGMENMLSEISTKAESLASKATTFDTSLEAARASAKEADRKMQFTVAMMEEIDKRFGAINARINSVEYNIQLMFQRARALGPKVIE